MRCRHPLVSRSKSANPLALAPPPPSLFLCSTPTQIPGRWAYFPQSYPRLSLPSSLLSHSGLGSHASQTCSLLTVLCSDINREDRSRPFSLSQPHQPPLPLRRRRSSFSVITDRSSGPSISSVVFRVPFRNIHRSHTQPLLLDAYAVYPHSSLHTVQPVSQVLIFELQDTEIDASPPLHAFALTISSMFNSGAYTL